MNRYDLMMHEFYFIFLKTYPRLSNPQGEMISVFYLLKDFMKKIQCCHNNCFRLVAVFLFSFLNLFFVYLNLFNNHLSILNILLYSFYLFFYSILGKILIFNLMFSNWLKIPIINSNHISLWDQYSETYHLHASTYSFS